MKRIDAKTNTFDVYISVTELQNAMVIGIRNTVMCRSLCINKKCSVIWDKIFLDVHFH